MISLRLLSLNGLTLAYTTVLASTTHPLPANHIHFESYLRYLALVWADITEAGAHRSFPSFPRRTVPTNLMQPLEFTVKISTHSLQNIGDLTVEGEISDPFMPAKSSQVGWNTTGPPFIDKRQSWEFHYSETQNRSFINIDPYTSILLSLTRVVFFAILTAFQLAIFYPPFSLSPVHLGIALPCANIGLGSSPSTVVGNFPRYCHPSYRRSTPNNFDLRADREIAPRITKVSVREKPPLIYSCKIDTYPISNHGMS